MPDKRSPLDRMIDAACGIPNGPQKTDNTAPRVTLKCKKCGQVRKNMPKHETDPEGTRLVLMLCPDCNPGDFDNLYYFDAAGKEIIPR